MRHTDIIRDIADANDLPFELVREVVPVREETISTAYHLKRTGRFICVYCDQSITRPLCNKFAARAKQRFSQEIWQEYKDAICSECREPIDSYEMIEAFDVEDAYPVIEEDGMPEHFESEIHVMYHPCGHSVPREDAKLYWTLDRKKLQRDIRAGHFQFDGDILD